MTNKEIYQIWAPVGTKWVDWVRPVAFINLMKEMNNSYFNFSISKIFYIDKLDKDTAFIIDLPSYESIVEALSLAYLGYRPIPVYNGTNEPIGTKANVDNHAIEEALIWGAMVLKKVSLDKDAPPAFLIDSNRLHRKRIDVSIFDNSWDVYPQDLPSPQYFLNNGIKNIVIRGDKVNEDLSKILYKHQQAGINIMYTNGFEQPIKIKLKRKLFEKED